MYDREENLRTIGRRIERPADATDQQVNHWVKIARSAEPNRPGRWTTVLAHPSLRRWALSAAAVAILAVGLFLAFQATPQSVIADEVFGQIGATLSSQPVLHLTVKDVELHGRRMNFEFMGADEGRSMFASIDTQSADSDTGNAFNAMITRDGNKGWLLIRRMQWNNQNPMKHVLPENGSLLIDVPVSDSTNEAVRQFFPMMVRPQEIQALIESLRQAAPDLSVHGPDNNIIRLEGVITRPENLDLQMFCQMTDTTHMIASLAPSLTTGMTKKDWQKIVQTVKKTLKKSLSEEDYQAVSQRLDLLTVLAMTQLQTGGVDAIREDVEPQRLDERLRTLLKGAKITVTYDSYLKRLRSVNMTNVGTGNGAILLRFDEEDIDRTRLRREPFASQPNVKIMSRDEAIYAMLLPLISPHTADTTK